MELAVDASEVGAGQLVRPVLLGHLGLVLERLLLLLDDLRLELFDLNETAVYNAFNLCLLD